MDSAWLTRMRWRRRGAWMWPAFSALTILEAVAGHALPPAGETETLPGALLVALMLNLLAVVLLNRPLGWLLRLVRRDLPRIVARDYAGTAALGLVATVLLGAGILHHSAVINHRNAMNDAIVRAQAFIGDRAPHEFRANVQFESTVPIEPGSLYRTCVPSIDRRRRYCVIVRTDLPFERSVRIDGSESNAAMFPHGAN